MTHQRYSSVAIFFHWAIASLIIANLYLGWRMGFVKGLAQFDMFQLHKSVGISILLFSVCRLLWRVMKPPPESPSLKGWERGLSALVHWCFYGVMIGMPLTGWLVVSTSQLNIPTLLFHTIPWPHFPGAHDLSGPTKSWVNGLSDHTHVYLAFGAVVLIALHVGGVLKHHLVDGDPVLRRMWPTRRPSQRKES